MNHTKNRIIFIGSGNFARTILSYLLSLKHIEVSLVITNTDKKIGRNKSETFVDSCKQEALACDIPVLTPGKLDDSFEIIKGLNPTFIVVCSYGQIVSNKILAIPKKGCLNIHPSLLPKYRGATPVSSALRFGQKETGVSIIAMSQKLDAGDIFLVKRVPIDEKDNFTTLSEKLATISSILIEDAMNSIVELDITPIPQRNVEVSYCKKFLPKDGLLDFNNTAETLFNIIRAYNPEPGTYTFLDGKRLKIIEAFFDNNENAKSGEVVLKNQKIGIGTKKGLLIPKKVQLEGKKQISIDEFFRGRKEIVGKMLG